MFNDEQVFKILERVVDEVLKPVTYDEELVPVWVDTICDRCMKEMAERKKPYKYVVTCQIMQRTGAGIHTATSCYWNQEEDAVVQYVWPKKDRNEAARLYCILTAVGMYL